MATNAVHKLSFIVQDLSFGGDYSSLMAHEVTRYNVLSQTPIGVVLSNVAHYSSRFSVVFAPRRGNVFKVSTFGRKRTREFGCVAPYLVVYSTFH